MIYNKENILFGLSMLFYLFSGYNKIVKEKLWIPPWNHRSGITARKGTKLEEFFLC